MPDNPTFIGASRTSLNQSWNVKESLDWALLPNPNAPLPTPWFDRIYNPGVTLKYEEEWLNDQILSRVDAVKTTIDSDDTTLIIYTPYLYKVRQNLRIGDGDDAEIVRVTAVDYTTGALTIVRAQQDTTAAGWTKDTKIYILPTNRAEYETNLADNPVALGALRTDIIKNYAMGFSLSQASTEVQRAIESYADLRQDPDEIFQLIINQLKHQIELQTLVGRPEKASTVSGFPSMGGLLYYISQIRNLSSTGTGAENVALNWTHINDAVKAIIRLNAKPDFILTDMDTHQDLAQKWSDARIMGISGPSGQVGFALNTIKTAIQDVSLTFLALDQIPPKTFIVCTSDKVTLAPVKGLGLRRMIKEPDALTSTYYETYSVWMNAVYKNADKYFYRFKFDSIDSNYLGTV